MKFLYVGVQDKDYPRNRLIRARLEQAGHQVATIEVPRSGSYISRSLALYRQAKTAARQLGVVDTVVLAEFAAQYAPITYLISRRLSATFLHDYFVGLIETNVEDWGKFGGRSLRAFAHRILDSLAVTLPDWIISDTDPRCEAIRKRTRKPVLVLPVETPEWAKPMASSKRSKPVILFYGNYIPLHGVATIASALSTCEARVLLIGDGPARASIKLRHEGSSLNFLSPVPENQLLDAVQESHIVLGIFGSSVKAATVIPNKVWQALACGRIVVTRQSVAYNRIMPYLPPGQLHLIPPDDATSLREVIDEIISSGSYTQTFPECAGIIDAYFEEHWSKFSAALTGTHPFSSANG